MVPSHNDPWQDNGTPAPRGDGRPSSRTTVAERLVNSSASRISGTTKAELLNCLSVFGPTIDTRVNKPEVVAAVMQRMADNSSRAVSTEGGTDPDICSAGELAEQAASRVCVAFREASLTAWVMTSLVPTSGMKEGSGNEVEIIRALPKFFSEKKGAYRRGLCSPTYNWDKQYQFNVKQIRPAGLIESTSCTMLADSPDALLSATDGEQLDTAYTVEIKTMIAVRTTETASLFRGKYGALLWS